MTAAEERLAWLQSRQSGLGGSDLGQIPSIVLAAGGDPAVDCSRWGGEWEVWHSKIHPITLDDAERDLKKVKAEISPQTMGHALESWVIDWACESKGIELVSDTQMTGLIAEFDNGSRSIRCSPDALGYYAEPGNSGALVGIEAKTSQDAPWDEVPFSYRLQAYSYMIAFGCSDVNIAACFTRHGVSGRIYHIQADWSLLVEIEAAADAWWQRHIIEGIAPKVDDTPRCSQELKRMHPRVKGADESGMRIASDDEVLLAAEIVRGQDVVKMVESDIKTHKNALRRSIGDAPGVRWGGGKAHWTAGGSLKITHYEIEDEA